MPKKALITGITGQVGSYMADLLVAEGYEVDGLIRRSSTSNTWRITHHISSASLRLVEGDITDPISMMEVVKNGQYDEIYNFAAQSHVHTSFNQPLLTWRTTAESVITLLEAIRLYSKHTKVFQASSSEMMGDNYDEKWIKNSKTGEVKRWRYQDENTRFSPQSPYAVAKLAAHNAVKVYRNSYNLHASCGIMFNTESPRRGDNFVTKKIINYMKKYIMVERHSTGDILKTTPRLKLGNLNSYRDWGYAADTARAAHLILQQEKPNDWVVATGETHQISDFLATAFSYMSEDWREYVEIDRALFRPAEVDYLCGDSTRLRKQTGWAPSITFEQLVQKMLKDVQ